MAPVPGVVLEPAVLDQACGILAHVSPASATSLLMAILLGASCSAREPESMRHASEPATEAPPAIAVPEPPTPVADDPPRTSCRSTRAPSRHPLERAFQGTTIAGRTFVPAWRRSGAAVETVLVSLDAAGKLVVTPVPVPTADPFAIGGDARGLVIVSVPQHGRGSLLQVELRDDGTLHPGRPTSLPEVAWGWPTSVEVDDTRVTLHHALATPGQSMGDRMVYTIDRATRRVLTSAKAAPETSSHCHAGACTEFTVIREGAEVGRTSIMYRGPAGEAKLDVTISSMCPAFYPLIDGDDLLLIAPGDPWRAVIAATSPPLMREAAIDPSLAPIPGCGRTLYEFPSTTHPGLLDIVGARRTLRTFERARQSFGTGDVLPEQPLPRWLHAAHADGTIEVAWDGGSGMMHTPTDDRGIRRYFRHWYFKDGQVALLRREGGRWRSVDALPLPLRDAEGKMSDGYQPLVLRHGLHAAVLLTSSGGEEAWLQPFLVPCAAAPGPP